MVTSALKFKVDTRHSDLSIHVSVYIGIPNCDCGPDRQTFGVLVSCCVPTDVNCNLGLLLLFYCKFSFRSVAIVLALVTNKNKHT